MIRSLLLDLDDTLLGNNLDTFMTRYFALLSGYAQPRFAEDTFLPHLIQATRGMIGNTDPELTNDGVFWRDFERLTGGKRGELEPFFQRFYETEFEQLRSTTVVRPAAAELVRDALARGLSVVVATNPLFPRLAIEQRLEWAGLPVGDYAFALVTTYENMHAAKPQPAYYREILTHVGAKPHEALMVGDDWRNDITPAAAVGLYTYWIAPTDAVPPPPPPKHRPGHTGATGRARGRRLAGRTNHRSGLRRMVPARTFLNPPPAADLLAELAAFHNMLAAMLADPARDWRRHPAGPEWSLNEIACHLRDVEREVHQARLRAILDEEGAFVPGVNADEWADERDYWSQDGRAALADFLRYRRETIDLLTPLPPEVWARQGQHTFFGPTSLHELVYLAVQHDRIHAQQIAALSRIDQ